MYNSNCNKYCNKCNWTQFFSLDTVSTQQQLNSTVNTHMFKLLSRDDEMMAQSPTTEYLSLKVIDNLMPNIRTVYQAHHGRSCVFIWF